MITLYCLINCRNLRSTDLFFQFPTFYRVNQQLSVCFCFSKHKKEGIKKQTYTCTANVTTVSELSRSVKRNWPSGRKLNLEDSLRKFFH